MNLNYLILAHKNFSQLDRLVKALTFSNTNIFIHIDKKVSLKALQKFDFFRNKCVTIVSDRLSIRWGGFSTVKATLALMKAAVSKSKNGYFIFISGQDFPIKSNIYIQSLLSSNYGTEYMTYWSMPYENWSSGGLDRIRYYWFVDKIGFNASRILYHLQKQTRMQRNFIEGLPPFGGSQWWNLTYDCVQYILAFAASHPATLDFFKHTLLSDEMFFQTIVLNSPFKANVINDNLRYVRFDGLNKHPDLLGVKDLPNLTASGALWARKFDEHYDQYVFERLERYIKV